MSVRARLQVAVRSGIKMHRGLCRRFVETQVMVLAPICPHWATHVWTSMLGHGRSPLWGPWPTVAAEDANVTKSWAFLKDSVKALRAVVGKEKKDKNAGAIYVADTYADWKVATLRHLQGTLGAGGVLPEKKAVVGAIKSGFLAEGGAGAAFASRSKDVLQFASFVLDEALVAVGPKGDATQVLEPVVSIDQKKILTENLEFVKSTLAEQARRPIELTVYALSEPDVPGPEPKKAAANPGRPTLALF